MNCLAVATGTIEKDKVCIGMHMYDLGILVACLYLFSHIYDCKHLYKMIFNFMNYCDR